MHRRAYDDKSDSVAIAAWCFAGILIALAIALIREGVLRLWPLLERWL